MTERVAVADGPTSTWRFVVGAFWAKAYERFVDRNDLRVVSPFSLRDFEGRTWSLEDFGDRPTLFVFTAPHCDPCKVLYPRLSDLGSSVAGSAMNVVLMSRGARQTNEALAREHRLDRLTVLGSRNHVEREWGVKATPWAVLVGPGRRILYSGVADARQLTRLGESARHPVLQPVRTG